MSPDEVPFEDPQLAVILARLRAAPALDIRSLPVAEARALSDAASASWSEGAPAMPVRDLPIALEGRTLAGRLYEPTDARGGALIVYVHGGGWSFGSIATHDGTMRTLARAAGCRVLGFDYRLAPEHPFPVPLDDVLDTLGLVEAGGLGAGIPAERIGIAGDSAGANLALGALLARRDRGRAPLAAASLFYGCYAPDFDTASHAALGDGRYLLSTANMRWYWENFLGARPDDPARYATPGRADLAGLPPLYLAALGLDPLRDDTLRLADALARAGAAFRLDHVPGLVHGSLRFARDVEAARRMAERGAAFLDEALAAAAGAPRSFREVGR